MIAHSELSPGAAMLHRVDERFFVFEKFLNYIAALVILGDHGYGHGSSYWSRRLSDTDLWL